MDGSVVLSHTSQLSLTMIVDAFVSDGNWHSINLTISLSSIHLSIDNGRLTVSTNQTISIPTVEIVIGGIVNEGVVLRGLDGCLQEFIVNDETNLLGSSTAVSMVGVVNGCSDGNLCSLPASCPNDSSCSNDWREYTCGCTGNLRPIDNQCEDLCLYGICNPAGVSKCNTGEFGE